MHNVITGLGLMAAGYCMAATAADFDVKFCTGNSSARLTVSGEQIVLTEEAAGEIQTIQGTIVQRGRMSDDVAEEIGRQIETDIDGLYGFDIVFEGADRPSTLMVVKTKSAGTLLVDPMGMMGPEIKGSDNECER